MRQAGFVDVLWAAPMPLTRGEAVLDDVERDRYASFFRPRDRHRYLTAHLLMRVALTQLTGIPPERQEFERTCVVCGAAHGKPRLRRALPLTVGPIPHVSVSYAAQRVVVATSLDAPLGVDVEHWSETDFAGFSAVALTRDEAFELLAFPMPDRPWAKARWWARKEAALKATGHGLRVDATSLRITPPDRPPRLLGWADDEVPRPTLRMADLEVPGSYCSTVAVLGDASLTVRVRAADADLAAAFGAH